MKQDFLTLSDLSSQAIGHILDLTGKIKHKKLDTQNVLKNKSVGLVFQKSSNRTRVSFEVGIRQLGGHCIYLGPQEINLGVRESTADVAKTLARYLDCIVARTYRHDDILQLAEYAHIPIINGLSDLHHPCQGLTDIFSIKEVFGELKGLTVAYVGDPNNVCYSLLLACAKTGVSVNIACPEGYEVRGSILHAAQTCAKETEASVQLFNSPQEAVKNVDVIYTDVWVSMGQENEAQKRKADFKSFQVDQSLMNLASSRAVFMHCLPAHRGEEVDEEVIDGSQSIVFDQAENRLHTQKAILTYLFQ